MMTRWLRRTLAAGSIGAVTSSLALAVAAVIEGKSPAQPINATSHWLAGDSVSQQRDVQLTASGVGFGTHLAATIFWASLLEGWMAFRPARARGVVVERSLAVAALAATVDYTVTPHRFTPGWELVLSKRAMAAAYAAMAAGFTWAHRLER